eukprot:gene6787-60828_t
MTAPTAPRCTLAAPHHPTTGPAANNDVNTRTDAAGR